MDRRTFLQTASSAAFGLQQTIAQPAKSSGIPIRLGFDTYSLRAFQWKAMQLLDWAATQKVDTIQISSSGDYESLEPGAPCSRERTRGFAWHCARRGHRLHLSDVNELEREEWRSD